MSFFVTASGRPSMGGSGSGGRDRFNSTNRDDAQSDTQVSSYVFTYNYLTTLRYGRVFSVT